MYTPAPPPSIWRRCSLALWAAIAAGTTILGLVTGLRYLIWTVLQDSGPFPIWEIVWGVIGQWQWILFAPIVLHLARRFPVDRPNWPRHLAIHFLGWIVITMLDVSLFTALKTLAATLVGNEGLDVRELFGIILYHTVPLDLLIYSGIVAAVHAIDYRRQYQERALMTSQLEMQLARARYQALEMQLQPHFLFNTLNTISALMDEDVQASRRVLTLLSDLLRSTLQAGEEHEVTLRREIGFIERYLEIQKIRFRDVLETEISIDPEVLNAKVPSLILQPLVENAFKHGMAPTGTRNRIVIRGYAEGNTLVLEVIDNGRGLPRKGAFPVIKKGIGLKNTEERLLRLYRQQGSLCLEELAGGGVRASIRIPLRLHTTPVRERIPVYHDAIRTEINLHQRS